MNLQKHIVNIWIDMKRYHSLLLNEYYLNCSYKPGLLILKFVVNPLEIINSDYLPNKKVKNVNSYHKCMVKAPNFIMGT